MAVYRLEYAKSARSGCKGQECKINNVKMEKGALKFGVWIEPANTHAFYSYKHWGCVTPKQLSNVRKLVQEEFDGDYDMLDGYDELTEDDQARVKRAIEEQHVADEDLFSVDPALNRLGAVEARKAAEKEAQKAVKKEAKDKEKAEKKAAKEAEKAEKKAEKEREKAEKQQAPKVAKQSKRKRAHKDEDDEETDDYAEPKERGRRVKLEEDVADLKPKRSKKQPVHKAEPEETSDEDGFGPMEPTKTSSSTKRSSKVKTETDETDLERKVAENEPPGRRAKSTGVKKNIKLEPADDATILVAAPNGSNDIADEAKEVKKSSRKAGKAGKAGHPKTLPNQAQGAAPLRRSSRNKSV